MTTWREQIDNDHIARDPLLDGVGNGSVDLRARLDSIVDPRTPSLIVGYLLPAAAASWNAMARAAWQAGVLLLPTSSADSFRPLATQQRIFTERYTTSNTGVGHRVCKGVDYWKRSAKFATAACPGTSNHGLGRAVDFGRPAPNVLPWMEKHAKAYGWQWELSSEEWHVHYMLGGALPAGTDLGPPQATKEFDMIRMAPQAPSTDAGKTFLVTGDCRIHLSGPENDQLEKVGVPGVLIEANGWDAIVRATALDAIGLRSIPPGQYAALTGLIQSDVADVDEAELARQIAPLIKGSLVYLDADQLAAIADAVNDEQAKRQQA